MRRERIFNAAGVELREDDGHSPIVVGHAAVFNEWYVMYDGPDYLVRERILPGSFDRAISEGQDVAALFNHDPSLLLGRTSNGTCRLSVDLRGLAYEVEPADVTASRDCLVYLRRKDVTGSSFAFVVPNGGQEIRYSDEADSGRTIVERDISDVDLYDVSPVTYPAYKGTDAGVRASEGVVEFIEAVKAKGRESLSRRSRLLNQDRLLRLVELSLKGV